MSEGKKPASRGAVDALQDRLPAQLAVLRPDPPVAVDVGAILEDETNSPQPKDDDPAAAAEATTFLELLPAEILEKIGIYLDAWSLVDFMDSARNIQVSLESNQPFWHRFAYNLDPQSIVHLMETSEHVRHCLKSEPRSFWQRLADLWLLQPDSILRVSWDDSLTIAERIVSLQENLWFSKCRVWRCLIGDPTPQLIEDCGESLNSVQADAVSEFVPGWENCETFYNGYFVLARNNDFVAIWDTMFENPVQVGLDLPPEELLDRPPMAMWKQFLLISPKVAEDDEFVVLKIRNLQRPRDPGSSVVIFAEDAEWSDHTGFIEILETSCEKARAVISHRYLSSSLLIVSIQEGTIERRIDIPGGGDALFRRSTSHQALFNSSIIFTCIIEEDPLGLLKKPSLLTVKATAASTQARLSQFDTWKVNVREVLPDGTVVVTRTCVRLETVFLEAFRQDNMVGEGELVVERMGTPQALLSLKEQLGGRDSATTTRSGSVILFCRSEDSGSLIFAVNYSSDPAPRLSMMYQLPLDPDRRLLYSSHGRFLLRASDPDRSEEVLAFHDVEDGRTLGYKVLEVRRGDTVNMAYNFAWMGETDQLFVWTGKDGTVLYLVKYF